jgi:hypothetical protein
MRPSGDRGCGPDIQVSGLGGEISERYHPHATCRPPETRDPLSLVSPETRDHPLARN